MDTTVINELNTFLKGEYMAINAYERFIDSVNDESIRKNLTGIRDDHLRHAGDISMRIRKLGGEPESGTGLAGFMASTMSTIQNISKKDDTDILKKAFEGEDKGIGMAEEIIKGDLDAESMRMVRDILSEDHTHLKKITGMLSEIGHVH